MPLFSQLVTEDRAGHNRGSHMTMTTMSLSLMMVSLIFQTVMARLTPDIFT